MRIVEGYVFIAEFRNAGGEIWQPVFGAKNLEGSDGPYHSLQLNGLVPYGSLEETLDGTRVFRAKRKTVIGIRPALLKLRIAQTEEEAERNLAKRTNLIVIATPKIGCVTENILLGPAVNDRCHYSSTIPGDFLSCTNFTTYNRRNSPGRKWTPFDRASYLSSQVIRQAGCPATIAHLVLRRLK